MIQIKRFYLGKSLCSNSCMLNFVQIPPPEVGSIQGWVWVYLLQVSHQVLIYVRSEQVLIKQMILSPLIEPKSFTSMYECFGAIRLMFAQLDTTGIIFAPIVKNNLSVT